MVGHKDKRANELESEKSVVIVTCVERDVIRESLDLLVISLLEDLDENL